MILISAVLKDRKRLKIRLYPYRLHNFVPNFYNTNYEDKIHFTFSGRVSAAVGIPAECRRKETKTKDTFSSDLGEVTLEVINTSTGETSYDIFDSGMTPQSVIELETALTSSNVLTWNQWRDNIINYYTNRNDEDYVKDVFEDCYYSE